MDFGIIAFATDQTISPGRIARLTEEAGFESVWFPEHSHLPTASGGWPGGDRIPASYARTIDQWVALGMAIESTSTITLGTGMTLVPQHDPVWLAKQAASVDHLSGGRLVMGVGYTWNRAELADHGVDFSQRRARTRECVELMRALWGQDVASYEGHHVSVSASQAWPKPIRDGGPPLVIGAGVGPRTLADLVDWADGWAPMFGRDDIDGTLPLVRDALADADRLDGFSLSVFGVPNDPAALQRVQEWEPDRVVFGAGGATDAEFGAALEAAKATIDAAGLS
jgi:probable F420-dependent oxidoreductase